ADEVCGDHHQRARTELQREDQRVRPELGVIDRGLVGDVLHDHRADRHDPQDVKAEFALGWLLDYRFRVRHGLTGVGGSGYKSLFPSKLCGKPVKCLNWSCTFPVGYRRPPWRSSTPTPAMPIRAAQPSAGYCPP